MSAHWLSTLCIATLVTVAAAGSAEAQQYRAPQPGDHVRVRSKKGVYHHGVVTGHDQVVHRDNLMAATAATTR